MPSTMPLRIGDELVASARATAQAAGRSAAQQIGYWAKLGRELERSGSVSVRAVAEVLAGARAYDDLDAKAQAVVRAEWSERIAARLDALDLGTEFAAEHRSWVELGPDGTTIEHDAAPPAKRRRGVGARARGSGPIAPSTSKGSGRAGRARTAPPAGTASRKPDTKDVTAQKATATKAAVKKAAAKKAPVKRATAKKAPAQATKPTKQRAAALKKTATSRAAKKAPARAR